MQSVLRNSSAIAHSGALPGIVKPPSFFPLAAAYNFRHMLVKSLTVSLSTNLVDFFGLAGLRGTDHPTYW